MNEVTYKRFRNKLSKMTKSCKEKSIEKAKGNLILFGN